jgi:hypothetical protein
LFDAVRPKKSFLEKGSARRWAAIAAVTIRVNLVEAGVLIAEARRQGIKVRFDVEDGRYRT